MRICSASATNQVVLGKDGCMSTMAAILCSVPKTHWAKIKFIMEILALLTKASKLLQKVQNVVCLS